MTTDGSFERRLVKALGHPLRLRLLEAVIESGEDSPVDLSKRLDLPLATVSRHMRMLRDLGFVEETRTEPRRGALKHFYRASTFAFIDDDDWALLPIAMRRGLARQTFRKVFHEAAAAGGGGGFDAPDACLVRALFELDDTGRREISQVIRDALDQFEAIQKRSDERRSSGAGSTGEVRPTRLAVLHFRSDEPPADGPRPSYR